MLIVRRIEEGQHRPRDERDAGGGWSAYEHHQAERLVDKDRELGGSSGAFIRQRWKEGADDERGKEGGEPDPSPRDSVPSNGGRVRHGLEHQDVDVSVEDSDRAP